jgi:iron complex transport system substrate-binding protein
VAFRIRCFMLYCGFVAAGCAGSEQRPSEAPAQRIVSLNPTTTELLFALGASQRLVWRSRWDVFPAAALAIPEVGDAMRPSVERVLAVDPDLVILYESGENAAAAERLREAGIPLLVLRIDRLAELRRAIDTLGVLLGDTTSAALLRDSVFASLERVRAATADLPRPGVFWHVWHSPLMTIGSGSFLHELVEIAGGRNVYADLEAPSAPVTLEDVVRRDPDVILSGPTTAQRLRTSPQWRSVRAVREGRVAVFDTMIVGRPSVRVGEAAHELRRLLHPGQRP